MFTHVSMKKQHEVGADGNCKVCGKETKCRFNIDFAMVFICEGCASSITVQQVHDWAIRNDDR
jgi:hypothetical protein